MSAPEGGRSGPRLIDAMPRPLLILFAAAALVGLVAALVVIVRPPTFETVPLEERRPPPSYGVTSRYSHDPGTVVPAPRPSILPPFDPPCAAVDGVRPEGGVSFLRRVRDALELACTVAGRGPDADLRAAVHGLDGATIRIADFERSGVESTVDLTSRTLSVNLKFTERTRPASHLVPVLLHEGWHLARPDRLIDAGEELAARRVELAACREFVPVVSWPRWCQDARSLTELPEPTARDRLVSAGYAR